MSATRADIQALVGRLNNLHEIFRVQGEILALGKDSIETLSALLLSAPSTFPEPRVAAAECLAAIGGDTAIAALIRLLDYHHLETLGPVQRLAEEIVRNAAARKLCRFTSQVVSDALLAALQRDHLIGAGQALANLGDTRAIPYLIECLEDDYKKEKAMESLGRFGHIAAPFLCDALNRPRLVDGVEPPVSLERRVRSAELLGSLKTREAVLALEIGCRDVQIEVRIASCVALVRLGVVRQEIFAPLIAGLDNEDLALRNTCFEALQQAGAAALPLIAAGASGHGGDGRLSVSARLVAIKLLGLIPDASAAAYLMSQLTDPEEIVRYRTVAALDSFDDEPVRTTLEEVMKQDASRRVRLRAREALQMAAKRSVAKAT